VTIRYARKHAHFSRPRGARPLNVQGSSDAIRTQPLLKSNGPHSASRARSLLKMNAQPPAAKLAESSGPYEHSRHQPPTTNCRTTTATATFASDCDVDWSTPNLPTQWRPKDTHLSPQQPEYSLASARCRFCSSKARIQSRRRHRESGGGGVSQAPPLARAAWPSSSPPAAQPHALWSAPASGAQGSGSVAFAPRPTCLQQSVGNKFQYMRPFSLSVALRAVARRTRNRWCNVTPRRHGRRARGRPSDTRRSKHSLRYVSCSLSSAMSSDADAFGSDSRPGPGSAVFRLTGRAASVGVGC
jgi:hypothetical protein